jgi:hypothetical protein
VCKVIALVVFVTGLAEKVAVVVTGRPETDSVTGLLKPFDPFTVTEYAAVPPAVVDTLDGLSVSEKSACGAAAYTDAPTPRSSTRPTSTSEARFVIILMAAPRCRTRTGSTGHTTNRVS